MPRESPFSRPRRGFFARQKMYTFSFNPDHSHITTSPPAIPGFTSRPGTGDQLFCAANDQLLCGRSAILRTWGIGYCGQGRRSGIVKGGSEIEMEDCLFERSSRHRTLNHASQIRISDENDRQELIAQSGRIVGITLLRKGKSGEYERNCWGKEQLR
jgi:hypothetical protein